MERCTSKSGFGLIQGDNTSGIRQPKESNEQNVRFGLCLVVGKYVEVIDPYDMAQILVVEVDSTA